MQIQVSVAPIILSRQERWVKRANRSFPFGISLSPNMMLNWYPKIVLWDLTGDVQAVEQGADVAPCHHMQSHACEPPREVLCQPDACSLLSTVPGTAEEVPLLECSVLAGPHCAPCCRYASSGLAPLATWCFWTPRNNALTGLCEKQVLQQWEH